MTTVDDIEVVRGLVTSLAHEAHMSLTGFHMAIKQGNDVIANECHERGTAYVQASLILNMLLKDADLNDSIMGSKILRHFEFTLDDTIIVLNDQFNRLRYAGFHYSAERLAIRCNMVTDLRTIVHAIRALDEKEVATT